MIWSSQEGSSQLASEHIWQGVIFTLLWERQLHLEIIEPHKPQSHSYLGLTAAHIDNLYHIHMSSSAHKNAEKKRLDHIWSPVLEGIQRKVDKNQTT